MLSMSNEKPNNSQHQTLATYKKRSRSYAFIKKEIPMANSEEQLKAAIVDRYELLNNPSIAITSNTLG